jgi:hypothetical protein
MQLPLCIEKIFFVTSNQDGKTNLNAAPTATCPPPIKLDASHTWSAQTAFLPPLPHVTQTTGTSIES